jgi:hypothetical protein
MANIIPIEIVENKIFFVKKQKVMIDRDLSALYGVETRVLIQAVKRNIDRFPADFMFQLSKDEMKNWISQIVISNKEKMGLRKLPYAFTEQGVAMLSSVLKSKRAVDVNIAIMRTFVKIRRMASSYKGLAKRIERLEKSQDMHGKRFSEIFKILDNLGSEEEKNKKEIGFKG